jgi:hypothetical protein
MNLVIVLVVAALVAVALGAYLLAARRNPVAVTASAPFDAEDGIVSEPVPIPRTDARAVEASTPEPEPEPEPVAAEPAPAAPAEVCWAKRFAPRNGALDDSTRLGVIRDLGLVRAPWAVPLLVQAYDEEPDPAHRRAVLAALALFRHLDARAVFERALRADDEGERAIAGAALADLGVTPSLSS